MAWTTSCDDFDYCPACGDPLDRREFGDGTQPYCPACDLAAYRNPEPMARVAIVDGNHLLLVEHAIGPDKGTWALPGGHPEHDEPLRVAAVRELEEETGIRVDPGDLTLVGDGFLALEDGRTMVSVNYAASREVASGTVEANDDAASARFWSREEVATDPPLARASGQDQLLDVIDRFSTSD